MSNELTDSASGESDSVTLTWESLLPHSVQRLRERRQSLQSSESISASVLLSNASSQPNLSQPDLSQSGSVQANSAQPVVSDLDSGDLRGTGFRRFDPGNHTENLEEVETQADDPPSAHALAVAQAFNAREESGEAEEESSSFFNSKLAGVVASAVAHVVLILFLAFVTLRMPKEPAGMAFASAPVESTEESVELVQPIEASEPESSEPTEPAEAALDLTSELTAVSSSTISDSLGEMATPADMVSSAAMSAVSSSIPSTSASFFGAAAGGNNFCYVIDCSGSMKGGPWEAARAELLKSLSSLKPRQRFYIILFGREIDALPKPGSREPASFALYASKENLEHTRRWLMGISVAGRAGASPKNAIEMALEKEPDCIYLLTDGVTRVKDVAQFIREQNRVYDIINGEQVKAPIHTIAYYSLDGQTLMRQIASENRGQFIYVPDPSKRK